MIDAAIIRMSGMKEYSGAQVFGIMTLELVAGIQSDSRRHKNGEKTRQRCKISLQQQPFL